MDSPMPQTPDIDGAVALCLAAFIAQHEETK